MKQKLVTAAALFIFGLLFSSSAHAQTGAVDLKGAEKIVAQYCSYLQAGNTASILEILGGDLLLKRSNLFSNPDSSQVVSMRYRNAKFHIEGSKLLSGIKAAVDLLIEFENGGTQKVRLIVGMVLDELKIIDDEVQP